MAKLRAIFPNALLLAAPLFPPPASASREGPAPILDPKRYTSPSSRFVLEVDPTHPQGSGPARYRLLRDGEEAWSVEKPFTFWDAVVTDAGVSVGYAYPHGIRGADRDEFTVAMVGVDGEVRARHDSRRERAGAQCPVPEPVLGLFLDSSAGRAVVRVRDGGLLPRETWWSYRLSDGGEIEKVDPARFVPELGDYAGVQAAAAVPGTTLTLVHWWSPSLARAFFALLDADTKPVWTLDLAGDYAQPSDGREQDRMWDWIRAGSAIAVESGAARFEIRSVAEQTRTRYEATLDPASDTGWLVREIGREPWPLSFDDPPEPTFPTIRLEKLGRVVIGAGSPAASSPIHDVLAFDFDEQGRFEVIPRPAEGEPGFEWCLVDPDGKGIRETRLASIASQAEVRRHWLRISDGRWLTTASGYKVGDVAKAWWADTRSGELAEIEGFDCPPVETLSRDAHGGFVVLAAHREEYGSTPVLLAFDAQGRPRWSVTGARMVVPKDPSILFAPNSVAVAGDGTSVVTDSIRKTLQLFDSTGRFARSISLAETWGEARYPGHVVASGPNEILVHDSGGGSSTIWRMRLDGEVVSSLQPRHPDGHSPVPRGGSLRVAPDGRLWTTDGQMLQRLGPDGAVDHVVGNVPDSQAPTGFDDPFVDSLGRLLVLDRRARVVQVFDREGRRLAIGRLDAEDTPVRGLASPFADPGDGSVLVRVSGGEYVRFDERGTRLGRSKLASEPRSHRCVFRPGTAE